MRRKCELADLSLLEFPPDEGPTPAFAICMLLDNGKLNKNGRMEYMGALRHKDPLLCTMSSLAIYFFWRWHISKEECPQFRHRRNWYHIKSLVASGPEAEMAYPTQLEEIWRSFTGVGVSSVKKSHAGRACGSRQAEARGVAEKQVSSSHLNTLIYTDYIYRSDGLASGTEQPCTRPIW
jgi:hypothetical protein